VWKYGRHPICDGWG